MPGLTSRALAQVLETADPLLKSVMTHHAFCAYKAGRLLVGEATAPKAPARPAKPVLVSSKSPLLYHAFPAGIHSLKGISLSWVEILVMKGLWKLETHLVVHDAFQGTPVVQCAIYRESLSSNSGGET
jgi:hypothetical protein